MTGLLTDRAKAEREAKIRVVVSKLAHEVPELSDLDSATLEKVARIAMFEEVKGKLKKAAELERIPYQVERERFIARASRTGSERTRKLYAAALDRLETWCTRQGISPLELTPARADDWIEAEKAEGRAPATVRLAVSGASAFWTWLERRHSELHNPFRGTRARPMSRPRRKLAVPSDAEIELLEAAAKPELRAAIVIMAQAGLRVGGLPGLSINGTRWSTTSKGKDQGGKVPDEAREAITRAELPLRSPFKSTTTENVAKAFEYLAKKLHAEGKLRARYSVHDLRHAFAVRLYKSTHDVYKVEKALGHANVAVTEHYLVSLGIEQQNP
ncbi:MAG: tyrosine-type recombinase/integrase [Spirochaetia bacterium]|jgi:site-specific recombinase XerD